MNQPSLFATDSNLDELASVVHPSQTARSMHGIGGDHIVTPYQSAQEAFWFYNTRWLIDGFALLWQCQRVLNTRPEQMQAAWGELIINQGDRKKLDQANKWLRGLKRLYCQGQMAANRYGGATVIRYVDDGQEDFSQPVDRDNIKKVRYSRVFDRYEVYPDPDSYLSDPTDPEHYLISLDPQESQSLNTTPDGVVYGTNTPFYKIHKDRIIRFDGMLLTADNMKLNQGWHGGKLIPFLPPLLRYLEAMGYATTALKSFEFVTFMVKGLYNQLSSSQGKQAIKTKLSLNQAQLNAARMLLMDLDKEQLNVVPRRFNGVKDIIEEARLEMQGASGLDEIELWGKHPTGLQATGQSQRLEKARKIAELCSLEWGNNLEGVMLDDRPGDLDLYLLSDESGFNELPEDYSWQWNFAIDLTPEEEAEVRRLLSEADKNNIESGIYAAEEARSRYEGDKFNQEIVLDDLTYRVSQEQSPTEPEQEPEKQEADIDVESSHDSVDKFQPLDLDVVPDSVFDDILTDLNA